jgi:hypothetical protein
VADPHRTEAATRDVKQRYPQRPFQHKAKCEPRHGGGKRAEDRDRDEDVDSTYSPRTHVPSKAKFSREDVDTPSSPRRPLQGKSKAPKRTVEERDAEEDADAMCSQVLADGPSSASLSEKKHVHDLFAGMNFILTGLKKEQHNKLQAMVTRHGGTLYDFSKLKPGREPSRIVVVSRRCVSCFLACIYICTACMCFTPCSCVHVCTMDETFYRNLPSHLQNMLPHAAQT